MRAKNKIVTGVATGIIVVAGASAAYAYWSTSGTGTGSAPTSAGAANLALAQTSTISNMYPGDAAQAITGTVTNNASSSAFVASVTVSIASVTQASGVTGSCAAGDYAVANPVMNVGKDIAAGTTVPFSGASIQFNNKATNQDGCKGATVNLAYAAA